MMLSDLPSLNAAASRLRCAAGELAAASAVTAAADEPGCPRHLCGEAAAAIGSASVLAMLIDAAGDALTSYAHHLARFDAEQRALHDEAERVGLVVTAEQIAVAPGPRVVTDASREADRAEDLARLNRRRLALHESRARIEAQLQAQLARHAAAAVAVADGLR